MSIKGCQFPSELPLLANDLKCLIKKKKWLKNYVCTSNCKGICFFVGRGRMFIHFLRSTDITLIARRSLVHLRKMEFRKNKDTLAKGIKYKGTGTKSVPKGPEIFFFSTLLKKCLMTLSFHFLLIFVNKHSLRILNKRIDKIQEKHY